MENGCRDDQSESIAHDEYGFAYSDSSNKVADDCPKEELIGRLAKATCRASSYGFDQLGNADGNSKPDSHPSNYFCNHSITSLSIY